jgi:hypothetical protein
LNKAKKQEIVTWLFLLEAIPAFRYKFFAGLFFFSKPQKELPLVALLRQEKNTSQLQKLFTVIWAKK